MVGWTSAVAGGCDGEAGASVGAGESVTHAQNSLQSLP